MCSTYFCETWRHTDASPVDFFFWFLPSDENTITFIPHVFGIVKEHEQIKCPVAVAVAFRLQNALPLLTKYLAVRLSNCRNSPHITVCGCDKRSEASEEVSGRALTR